MMRVFVLLGVASAMATQNAFTTLLNAVDKSLQTAENEKATNQKHYNTYMCTSLKALNEYADNTSKAAGETKTQRTNWQAAKSAARVAKMERDARKAAWDEASRRNGNEVDRSADAKGEHDAAVLEATNSINLLTEAATALEAAGKKGFLQVRPEVQNLIELYMPSGESFLSTKIDNAVDAVAESFRGMVRQKLQEVQELNKNELNRQAASETMQKNFKNLAKIARKNYEEQAATFSDQSQQAADAHEEAASQQAVYNQNLALLRALQKQMDDTRAEFIKMHTSRDHEVTELTKAQGQLKENQKIFSKSAKRSGFIQLESEKSRRIAHIMALLTTGNMDATQAAMDKLIKSLETEIGSLNERKKVCLQERRKETEKFDTAKSEEDKYNAKSDAESDKQASHTAAATQDDEEATLIQSRLDEAKTNNDARAADHILVSTNDAASLEAVQKACGQILASTSATNEKSTLLQQPNFRDKNAAAGNSLHALCQQVADDLQANIDTDKEASDKAQEDFEEFKESSDEAKEAAVEHEASQDELAANAGTASAKADADAADAETRKEAAKDILEDIRRAESACVDADGNRKADMAAECGCYKPFVEDHAAKVQRARDEISGIKQVKGMFKQMASFQPK